MNPIVQAALVSGICTIIAALVVNRRTLKEVHTNVNHRLDETIDEMRRLRTQVTRLGGDPTDSAPDEPNGNTDERPQS